MKTYKKYMVFNVSIYKEDQIMIMKNINFMAKRDGWRLVAIHPNQMWYFLEKDVVVNDEEG